MAFAGVENARGDSHDDPVKLVSNTGQSLDTSGSSNNVAQQFTTGSNEHGYVLTEVRIYLRSVQTNTTRTYVTVNSDSSGNPGAALATLSNPPSFTENAVNNFTLSTHLALAKETEYWVVVNEGLANNQSHSVGQVTTSSTDEDSDSLTGWSIANNSKWKMGSETSWSTTSSIRPIHLRGYAEIATTTTDATLSALAITDSGSDAVTLTPTFAAATTSYTASVENDIEEITVTPTTNVASATFEFLDGSDMSLTDADDETAGQQVSLDVGANTFKVKVTAEDGNTTETYTVVVTREAAVVTLLSNFGSPATSSLIGESIRRRPACRGYSLDRRRSSRPARTRRGTC